MPKKNHKEITVSVGCVLKNDNILMVRRSEKKQPDIDLMWELPGGKVEEKENPSDSAIREIAEETGYQAYVSDYAPYTYSTYWEYEQFFLKTNLMCFECRIIEDRSRFSTNDAKIKETRWWKVGDIDFSRVLPGSREFIWWIAEKNSIKLKPRQADVLSAYLRFECIDQKRNHKKFYNVAINIRKEISPHYEATRSWGRIDFPSKGNIREVFRSDPELRKYLLPIFDKRITHGYLVRDYSTNFPFRTWLDKHSNKIDNSQLKLF